MARDKDKCTVTGPGIERNGYPAPQIALSAAITFAQRSRDVEGTFYARDEQGDVYGYADNDGHGVTLIYKREERK